MAQLTTLDGSFRKAPDPDTHPSMAVGAVAIVSGTAPNFDILKTLLAERIQAIPQCGNAELDLTQQVRRWALPQPGDEGELFRAIAHALERPLDTGRPLWECWIIEGLTGNRWAILIKIHHDIAHDISAAQLLTRLCDDADHDMFASNAALQHISAAAADTRSWTDTLRRAPASVLKTAAQAVAWPLTWTSATAPTATRRRYRTVRVPRAAVDAVCRKFGVTANDVALAAITEGFRTVLLRRGEQPRADSLPTSAAMLPHLPVEHPDPITQLRTVYNRLHRPKHHDRQQGASISDYLPFALCAKVVQALIRLPQQGLITLTTNGPGPRHRLQLMGQRLDQLLPIPPTALELSTGVAVLSYGDELVFGITAAYDAAVEMEQLAAGIELGMARLQALSQDSVLLFTKDRRKGSSRGLAGGTQRRTTTAVRARH